GYDFLCSLRSSKLPIIYVVNKMNGGVSRKELLEYLRLKKLHFIPMVGSETIYGAEYSCRFVYDLESGKNRFGISLHDVVKGILSMQN
ncbi:MAG TPA: hypothetical protein VFC96_05315, partial [Anaerovoracaceae bacterium]|nr:hypothetical protein [Anaerovoracaceae bacterium]